MLKKITLLLFISSFTISFGQGMFNMFANNQTTKKNWQIGFGADLIMFSDDDVSYIGDKTIGQLPRFNITGQISRDFSLDFGFSINGFDDLSFVKNEISYFSFDFSGRYYVLTKEETIDPYLFAGLSLVNFKDIYSPTVNLGLGVTFWISQNIGLNAQAMYKAGIVKQKMPSHPQFSAGIIFGFDNQKKINYSRCSFNR